MQHTLNINWNSPSGAIIATMTATGTVSNESDIPIASGATDFEVDIPIPISPTIEGFCIMADGGDMTIKTNSSSTPAQTLSLTANVPLTFVNNYGTNPITTAVTKMYVSSTVGGTLRLRVISTSSPNDV